MKLRNIRAVILILTLCASSFGQGNETELSNRDVVARDAVKAILTKAGNPSSIALSFENRSTVPAADATQFRKSLEQWFKTSKVSLVKPERAQTEIKITLSENQNGLLWIAEIGASADGNTAMDEFRRFEITQELPTAAKLELHDEIIYVHTAHILDFAKADGKTYMFLVPNSVFLQGQNIYENPKAVANIPHEGPWPRDLRARLLVRGKDVEIHYPGYQCKGSAQDLSKLDCHDSDDPWPLTTQGDPAMSGFFSPVRNFFTGAVSVADVATEQNLPPYYTAARVGDGNNALWLFAGMNGKTRLFAKLNQPVKTFSGWGSSIATLPSDCGNRFLALVSRPGDATLPDQLVAIEIVNRDAVTASQPIELKGSVDSMWTASDNSAVHVVVKNTETGVYEAHRITVRCGR